MLKTFKHVVNSYRSLKSTAPGTDAFLAWKCMCENMTYRLGDDADRTPTIGFRVIVRTLRKIRSGGDALRRIEGGDPSSAFYDGLFNAVDARIAYVEAETGTRPGWFICQEEAPGVLRGKLCAAVFVTVAFPLALRCLFSAHQRVNRALHIQQLAEVTAVRHLLAANNIKIIYDNAPYLIDSNWRYVLLSDLVREYIKLPSPGPLKTHNAITLCDTLVTTSGYHEEELPHLNDVRFKKKLKWVVEHAYGYIHRYRNGSLPEPKPKTLGFYSHASWLRKAQGHRSDGLHIDQAEDTLLLFLRNYLKHRTDYSLVIFLHPREKREDTIEKTKAHYTDRLNGVSFSFAPAQLGTAQCFEMVDIALAAFSTIVYERLFCGYKMLIGNIGIQGFPISSSNLNALCFSDEVAMADKIESITELNNNAFFETYNLWNYHHSNYPTLAKKNAVE